MYAIIETGGKQYRIQENDFLFIEKLEVAEGETVVFDKVLMAGEKVGAPYVEGAKVTAQIVDADVDDIQIGDPVEMVFRKIREDGPDGVISYGFKFKIVK